MRLLFLLLALMSTSVSASLSVLVYDVNTGQPIISENAEVVRPVASITKLMTVLIVLEAEQPKDEIIKLDWKESRLYHTRLPRSVKSLTRDQLIDLALIKSDNFAAYHLCSSYTGGVESCVQAMNQKAHTLGMYSTVYTDPTGLEETNISTARDLIKLIIMAKSYPEIVEATKPSVEIKVKRHWWQAWNTSPIVRTHDDDVVVSKTGYISSSGGCLVMLMNTEVGQRIIALLGSKNTHTRFPEAEQTLGLN